MRPRSGATSGVPGAWRPRCAGMGRVWLFSHFVLAGFAHAQACPLVDRGSPTDGVTTISVLSPAAPCTDPLFAGWQCLVVRSSANDNGALYDIDVRWNRVGQSARATFTWLVGGASLAFMREESVFAQQVQDDLDANERIRTVDLKFLGAGTAAPPRNGFVNIAAVYADLLEYLVAQGIAEGVLGHHGNSGGSMMGANALAYHRLDEVLDGVVFGGGPFWSDLRAVCTEPASPMYGTLAVQQNVDGWNWGDLGGTYCVDHVESDPSYECRSTLGPDADASYPGLIVSVLVGTADAFNPWIDASASDYWQKIVAERKTFDRPNAPHLVVGSQVGADAVYQRIVEIADLSVAPAIPSFSWGMVVMLSLLLVAVGVGARIMRPLRAPEGTRARRS